jgi:hypothetical protein
MRSPNQVGSHPNPNKNRKNGDDGKTIHQFPTRSRGSFGALAALDPFAFRSILTAATRSRPPGLASRISTVQAKGFILFIGPHTSLTVNQNPCSDKLHNLIRRKEM